MRHFVSALIMTTALTASAALADNAAPQGTAAEGTPAFNSVEELNAHLSKDVHETRSKEYQDVPKRTDIVPLVKRLPTKEAQEKYFEDRKKAQLEDHSSAGTTKRPLEEGENPDGSRPGDVSSTHSFSNYPTTPIEVAKPKVDIRTPATPKPPEGLSTLPESTALHPAAGNPTAPVAAELSDGTQAVFRADGGVSVITAEGRYRTPPDGVLTLKDGTSFTIENGARVDK